MPYEKIIKKIQKEEIVYRCLTCGNNFKYERDAKCCCEINICPFCGKQYKLEIDAYGCCMREIENPDINVISLDIKRDDFSGMFSVMKVEIENPMGLISSFDIMLYAHDYDIENLKITGLNNKKLTNDQKEFLENYINDINFYDYCNDNILELIKPHTKVSILKKEYILKNGKG